MSTAKTPTFRFAPSPNGLLHLGHAYSALLNQQAAKNLNGVCRLRIEDIDKARSQQKYIAAIYRDLHWLGLSWPEPVRQQSKHMADYKSAIDQLNELGLLYPCFASRGDIKSYWSAQNPAEIKRDPDGALLYPGLCKHLPDEAAKQRIMAGEPYSLRLHMDKALSRAQHLTGGDLRCETFEINGNEQQQARHHEMLNPSRWGDVIIARKDVPTSYHLSVVVDDHLEGITHICRGVDLEAATDVHRILQINLGYLVPSYHHHDLVMSREGKLSKSKAHKSLFELRAEGLTASEIRNAAEKGASALSTYLP